jgi:hypothetical protein
MMKKVLANFGNNILSRNEMKKVLGSASATANCGGGVTVTCQGTSCAASDPIPAIGEKGGCACTGPEGSSYKDCPQA